MNQLPDNPTPDTDPHSENAPEPIVVTRWVDHRRRQSALTAVESVPIPSTRMNPAAILGTLESWSLRYGLHVWTPGPPESCWRLAYNIFRHAARQVEAGELQALPAA